MKRKNIVILLILVFSASLAATFFFKQQRERQAQEKRKAGWANLTKTLESRMRTCGLEAGLVVEDLQTKSMIVYNADKRFASASLVKLPIMMACFNAANKNLISLDDALTLKGSHKVLGSGVLKESPAGSRFTIGELVELMITQSDNTACNILIGLIGFDYINRFFKALGLKDTNLSRKMMDFTARKKGVENYTTAIDMAFCLEMIYRGKFLGRTISQQSISLLKKQHVNDRIPAKIPDSIVVAHKTGLERRICHDVGIMFTPQGDFLISVLTKNAKRTKIAKRFIAQIALDVYEFARSLDYKR